MKVDVRYFASVREALGAGESVEMAEGSTVGDLRATLIARGGVHAEALAHGRALRMALNQTMCRDNALLLPGSEIAFFPPVTGG